MPYGPPRGCVFLARKAEPASGLISQEPRTGNERASRYTPRTCEVSRQEARDRGTSIVPKVLAFVNCAHEASILRDPRRLDSLSLNRATAESLFEETHPLSHSLSIRVYARKFAAGTNFGRPHAARGAPTAKFYSGVDERGNSHGKLKGYCMHSYKCKEITNVS